MALLYDIEGIEINAGRGKYSRRASGHEVGCSILASIWASILASVFVKLPGRQDASSIRSTKSELWYKR